MSQALTVCKTSGDMIFPELLESLKYLNKHRAIAGWPAGGREHLTLNHATQQLQPSGMDTASVMIQHETGLAATLPKRSVLQPTMDRVVAEGELPGVLAHWLLELLQEKLTAKQMLKKVGDWYGRQIAFTFELQPFIALSEYTIENKGHATILVDSGQAVEDIASRVRVA